MGTCGSNYSSFDTDFEGTIDRAQELARGPKTIEDLYDEILVAIFEYISPNERNKAVRHVCLRWMNVIMGHPRLRCKRTLALKHCKLGPALDPAKIFMTRYLAVNKLVLGSNVSYFKGLDAFWRSIGTTVTHMHLSNEAVKYFSAQLSVLENFKRLQTLKVEISDHYQWQVIHHLSTHLKHLRVVVDPCFGCYQKCILNHDRFNSSQYTNLKSFELNCFNICMDCLLTIVQSYSSLIDFSIYGVEKLQREFIQELARNLPHLRELTIHCSKTNQSENVFDVWPIMTELKRFQCAYLTVTEPKIDTFCRRCPYVTELTMILPGSNGLTCQVLKIIATKLKNLQLLHLEVAAGKGEKIQLNVDALCTCKTLKCLILPNFQVDNPIKQMLFYKNRDLEKIVSLQVTEQIELKKVTLRKSFLESLAKQNEN